MIEDITKSEFFRYYEAGLIYDIVTTNTHIYAKVIATEDLPERVVRCPN